MSLDFTPVASIPGLVTGLRSQFNSGISQSLEWRKKQLMQLFFMVDQNKVSHSLGESQHTSLAVRQLWIFWISHPKYFFSSSAAALHLHRQSGTRLCIRISENRPLRQSCVRLLLFKMKSQACLHRLMNTLQLKLPRLISCLPWMGVRWESSPSVLSSSSRHGTTRFSFASVHWWVQLQQVVESFSRCVWLSEKDIISI